VTLLKLLGVAVAVVVLTASDVGVAAPPASGTYDYLAPSADRGPVSDVAAVKAAIPRLIETDTAVGRLPLRLSDRRPAFASPAEASRRAACVEAAWSPSRTAAALEEWETAIEEFVDDPSYQSYSANRFVVQQWQGVTVTSRSAFAKVLGYEEYRTEAGWVADEPAQWQISLVRSSGTWRLDAFGSVFPAPEA
jgi:hypothetical protein